MMSDQMTDNQLTDNVNRIRKAEMDQNRHPLDAIVAFLRDHSSKPQLKRLYGSPDHKIAAGRATHGDAFRMKPTVPPPLSAEIDRLNGVITNLVNALQMIVRRTDLQPRDNAVRELMHIETIANAAIARARKQATGG